MRYRFPVPTVGRRFQHTTALKQLSILEKEMEVKVKNNSRFAHFGRQFRTGLDPELKKEPIVVSNEAKTV
jgi:hypothetical protein